MCLHKTDINPIFNSCAIFQFNEVHVNVIKSAAFYELSAHFKIKDCNRSASGISTGKISLSYTFNEDDLTRVLFLHFGRSKIHICGFNNQMHLHMSSFVWTAAQTTSWSVLSDRIYITKCMKWPGVNSPYIFFHVTVGTESIQTPLNFSLFVILQPFAKII